MTPTRRLSFVVAALASGVATAGAQTPASARPAEPPITIKPVAEMPLWSGGAPGAVADSAIDRPTITFYVPPASRATGTMVVIFPGGGYQHLATEKEGTRVAEWLDRLGVASAVVKYRLGPRYRHPSMLHDAQRAVRTARARAAEWRIDTARIGVLGFSAGGHLASSVGTHFDAGVPGSADAIERMSARPSFMILMYPVITMDPSFTHAGSRRNLIGDGADAALQTLMSSERQVTANTPPTFIVHTTDDGAVPVENAIAMYRALRDAKVPVELHVFETGPHGFGMAPDNAVLSTWAGMAERWMRRRGLLGR